MQRGVGAVTTTKHTENGVVVTITTCIHGRSRRSGHGLTTFSATNFFHYSLPFKVIAHPPLRQHFGTTWPDHFSKADYDPGSSSSSGPKLLPRINGFYCATSSQVTKSSDEKRTEKTGRRRNETAAKITLRGGGETPGGSKNGEKCTPGFLRRGGGARTQK